MEIDLKKLLEGKEGEVARHFGITISAVSQWVVNNRVPAGRAVALAKFLGLDDKLALLSPESTGGVNELLGNGLQSVNASHEQGGNNAMMFEITRAILRIEDRLKKLERLERRRQEIERRGPPRNAWKRKP